MAVAPLKIADREFASRLILGTGKFASPELMRDALEASDTEMVTVALRRADLSGNKDCLLYTSPSPRDAHESRMPSSA